MAWSAPGAIGATAATNNTTAAPGLPSYTAGQGLFIVASSRGNSGLGPATLAISGDAYTELASYSVAGVGSVYLWGREADGTETGATVVPTGGASGGTILAFGWAQSGGDTGTLGTLAVTTATASDSFADTQIETPAITPGADNTCVVAVGMWANDYSAFGSMTAPTWADGLIGAVDSTLGADASLAVAYKIQTTASAISADAFVIGGGVTAVDLSFCVALRAAAGAPTIRFFQYNWPHQRHSRL